MDDDPIRSAQLLRLKSVLEEEIDGCSDSILICDVGPIRCAERDLTFIGYRSYEDTVIPTVI